MSKACKILKGTCGACGGGGDRPTPVDDVELKDLKDVSIHTPVDGQTLKYDASTGKWRNEKDEVALNMEEINDVVTHELEDGDILIYDKATMKWRNGAVVTALSELEDVEYQDIQDGDILKYDAETQKWITAPVEDLTEIVTEWEEVLSDEKVPSEKLVKGELDNRLLQVDTLPTDAVEGTIVQLKEDGKVYIANEDGVFEETVKELPFVLDDIEDGNVLKYNAETDTFIPSIDADSIFLTQDEYDALTPEQKGNGNTYTIIGESEDRMISSTEIEHRDEALNVILDRIEGDETVPGSIKNQISKMNNLTKEIVEELPDVEDASENVLYLKKIEGSDVYEEYTLVTEGDVKTLVMIGTTETDLSAYYTKSEVDNFFVNKFEYVKQWYGTQAEYDALTVKPENTDFNIYEE